jgi:hypothetical protein
MKKQNFEKIVKANISKYNELNENKTAFCEYLRNNVKELKDFTLESLRGRVKAYFKEYKNEKPAEIVGTINQGIKFKASKTEQEALQIECEKQGIPLDNVKHFWFKSEHFSLFVDNKTNLFEVFKNELIEYIDKKKPIYPKLTYPKFKDANLFVINPADIHIGKLASELETKDPHNNELIIKRVKDGVMGLLQKASGFNIDKILFVIGNDILHVDNARRTTTSGTPQDTDGMWYENFLLAQRLYIDLIELLIQVAPIHIQYDSSNHDYTNGFFLAQNIEAWFKNHQNITFNVGIAHRKYFNYGNNLIGTTHGDGAKETDLPLLMAQESSEKWHIAKHRYFYISHIHHKKSKDYGSVCVESFRSPSGTDSWHHRNGYQHAPKAVEGFIHHKEDGQIARITHIFY